MASRQMKRSRRHRPRQVTLWKRLARLGPTWLHKVMVHWVRDSRFLGSEDGLEPGFRGGRARAPGPADGVLTQTGCTLDLEMRGLRARRGDRLLELEEVERRLKPFGRRYLGVREIPLDAIVGTDGRAGSFTRDFRPLHAFSRDRMRSLESAFADGGFPPIVAVKLGETYFVIDGHHRAALARRGGAA